MNAEPNTLFLRLEGPLQAWGDNSKFVIYRTMKAATKSGVLGLICCAMGVRRGEANQQPIPERFGLWRDLALLLLHDEENKDGRPKPTILRVLNTLKMGVRIDRAGTRWWDYHTVGAKVGLLRADGKGIKRTGGGKNDPIETLISRREYLCDASFLVALKGDAALIEEVATTLRDPKWPLFLGRKSCPPSAPIFTKPREDETWTNPNEYGSLREALGDVPWHPRLKRIDQEPIKGELICLTEWPPHDDAIAPPEAEVWYDSPISFDPPVHGPRLVVRDTLTVEIGESTQKHTPPPPRPQAKYASHKWTDEIRPERLKSDQGLCVFCKQQASQVHHASYRRAGGNEQQEDLRSLCRLCHDAVTMIEYGTGMGLDRVDPSDPRWSDVIIAKRDEIRRWRSEEGRRRALRNAPDRVRRDVLEEDGE